MLNSTTKTLISNFNNAIIEPIIALLFGLAFLYFFWGLFQFIVSKKSGGKEGKGGGMDIETGRKHMMWGIIGMVIMVSSIAIIRIVINTFGIDSRPIDDNRYIIKKSLENNLK